MKPACKVCSNAEGNRLYVAREMASNLGDRFTYLECAHCGCLQLLEIPTDMGRYYPADYYSLRPHGIFLTFVRRRWSADAYGLNNLIGWLFKKVFFAHRSMLAIARVAPKKDARILDVGCGRGNLLHDLAWLGFTNLTGADPFIEQDLAYSNGVRVYKRPISEVPGQFDLIMLNHSFEHMSEPVTVMKQLADRLAPSGQIILGIPVSSSYAWRHYGVNWVSLDAPRHFFLHSTRSIELLAAQAGLTILDSVQEGNDEQFWGSEQYACGMVANDPRAIGTSVLNRLKAWPKLRRWRAQADELNRQGEADMVCFHLQHVK